MPDIKTRYENGTLVFYEGEGASRTTTGHPILSISPTEIKVGSSNNDVDFKVMLGSGSIYALFDAGTPGIAFAGVDVALSGDLTVTVEDISIAQGKYLYLDGQGGDEYIYSSGSGTLDIVAATTIALSGVQ